MLIQVRASVTDSRLLWTSENFNNCAAPSQKYFALSLKHAKEGNIIDMHTINCCFPVKF